jgi:SPP1 family predicted phage head-tail adaptor
MSKTQSNKRRLYKYSIGDLRCRISLYDTVLTSAPNSISTKTYNNEIERWASIESVDPYQRFTDVNIDANPVTHRFIIRHDPTITSEKVIKFKDDIFYIVNIIIPEERNTFMILNCYIQGDEDKEVNL